MKWAGHAGYMGDVRNAYKTLFGKSEGKRPVWTGFIWLRIMNLWVSESRGLF
jgi:hypothetical protein